MTISEALQKLYKKITTHDNKKTNIAQLLNDLAENYPSAGSSVSIDKSLSQEGQAADAKAVGDALRNKLDATTAATKEALGLVKQAAAVSDATGEQPTKEEFNALLASLRAAGIVANS